MNTDKASTLKLLREGIGNTVRVVETRSGESTHAVRAHLPECTAENLIPILFLISSLAFLEATPTVRADQVATDDDAGEESGEFNEVDGWTPADFLSHLRFEGARLRLSLKEIRGRNVFTEITLTVTGDLSLETLGRGQSANRWLAFVEGRRHLQQVAPSELNS